MQISQPLTSGGNSPLSSSLFEERAAVWERATSALEDLLTVPYLTPDSSQEDGVYVKTWNL